MRFLFVTLFVLIPFGVLAAPFPGNTVLPGYKEPIRQLSADTKSGDILTAGKRHLDDHAKILVAVAKGERKTSSAPESNIMHWKPEVAPFGHAGTFVVHHVKDPSGKKVLGQFVNSDGETTSFFERSKNLSLFLTFHKDHKIMLGRVTSPRGYVSFAVNATADHLGVPTQGGNGLILVGGYVDRAAGESLVAALEDAYKRSGQSKGNMLDFIAHVLAPEPVTSIPAPYTTLDVGVPTILSKIKPGVMASCGKGI